MVLNKMILLRHLEKAELRTADEQPHNASSRNAI